MQDIILNGNKGDSDKFNAEFAALEKIRYDKLSAEDKAKDDILRRIKKELTEAGIPFWLLAEEKCNNGELDIYSLFSGMKPMWRADGEISEASIDFIRIHQAALFNAVYERALEAVIILKEKGIIDEITPGGVLNQILYGRQVYAQYLDDISENGI